MTWFFFFVDPRFMYLLTMRGQETTSRQIRDLEARLTAANEMCAAAEALLLGTAMSGNGPIWRLTVTRPLCDPLLVYKMHCSAACAKNLGIISLLFPVQIVPKKIPRLFPRAVRRGDFESSDVLNIVGRWQHFTATRVKPDVAYIRSPYLRTRPLLADFLAP
jgi:hypothetical protein